MGVREHGIERDRRTGGLAIEVLGRLAIHHGARSQEIGHSTSRGVAFGMLAARCNERVTVDELAEAIWPNGPPRTYRESLRVTVMGLRDLLEPDRSPGATHTSPLVGHGDAYELRVDPEWIDAERFESGVRRAQRALSLGEAGRATTLLSDALSLWGEPFAGADVPALQPIAERLRRTWHAAVTSQHEAQVQLGQEHLGDLEAAVEQDPLDERRWAHLMIALYRRGRQADALAAYREARHLLVEQLGVEPGQYLRQIEEQVLLQSDDLLTEGRPVGDTGRSWPRPPAAPGPLLLRDADIAAVDSLLGRWRLVTIAGPPGVGKTRLATAIAGDRTDAEVAWVSLGDVPAGRGALFDLASRLGVASEAGEATSEHRRLLARRVGDRPLLLVLDNVEHLVDTVSEVAAELLRGCPNLTLLTTSRRPLSLPEEQVFRLSPYRCERATGEPISPAAAYLCERVGFAREAPATAALERIAAYVGGLPLGLEQAARSLQSIDPDELAEHLELVTDRPALARAIGWSLDLLDPDARRLLGALAHLHAPWSVARARAIGTRIGIEHDAAGRAVSTLLEHSLVIRDDAETARHRVIEAVRHHVRSDTSVDEAHRFAEACAGAVTAEVELAAELIEGAGQAAGIGRLHELMPDIRATIIWAAEHDQPDVAAGVLARLRAWWWISGLYADGQTLHAVAGPMIERWRPSDLDEIDLRLAALAAGVGTRPGFAAPSLCAASLAGWLDDARTAGASPGTISFIAQLLAAGMVFDNRDAALAEKTATEAIESGQQAANPWLVAWGRYAFAVARARTDPIAGLASLEQAISAFAGTGDQLNAARLTMFLGHGSRVFGDGRGSERAFADAERWCAELGAAPVTQLDCELGRAQAADTAGDRDEAAARYRSLIPRLAALGDFRCAAVAQRNLAAIVAADGDLDAASALVARALETFRSIDVEETELAVTYLVRAEIAEAGGRTALAAQLLGHTLDLVGGSGVPVELRDLERIDRIVERLRSLLGPEQFAALEAQGREDRHL